MPCQLTMEFERAIFSLTVTMMNTYNLLQSYDADNIDEENKRYDQVIVKK